MDYHDPGIEAYMADYRAHFHTEPTHTTKKGINYGIAGHDMTLYFLNALHVYGPRFILSLDDYRGDLVQGSLAFDRVSRRGGYENTHITFYQFEQDMSIDQIEVPELPKRRFFFRPMDGWQRDSYLNVDAFPDDLN